MSAKTILFGIKKGGAEDLIKLEKKMAKSNKNQYYLSFDINTKDPNFIPIFIQT